MGKNKKNKNDGEEKKKGNGGDKNNVNVVLKADLHCEGCANKLIKSIRAFDGVEAVTIEEDQKITVIGNVDPAKLREKVEQKMHKKVELLSPKPTKNDDKEKPKESTGGDNAKQDKKVESKEKSSSDKSNQEKSENKKPAVTTAVLKVHLHCDGCIHKIHKTVTRTAGYQEMKIDKQKNLVTVTGAMDMKALAELLQKQLKKDVEIVPPKKEEAKKEKGGGDEAGGSGEGEQKVEGNKMQAQMLGYPYMYGAGFGDQVGPYHAPQLFSDENPNACSLM